METKPRPPKSPQETTVQISMHLAIFCSNKHTLFQKLLKLGTEKKERKGENKHFPIIYVELYLFILNSIDQFGIPRQPLK